jgi:hypothetical protein
MSSTTLSSFAFPRLTTLEHLQQYTNATDEAHGNLKSCLWQLTKSRRKGNVMMSVETSFKAASLRENWRARHRLLDVHENQNAVAAAAAAELVDEDHDNNNNKKSNQTPPSCIAVPEWKLVDILQEKENAAAAAASSTTKNAETDPTAGTGLRQRKVKNTPSNEDDHDDAVWTLVQEEDLQDDDEEQILLQRDPIEFFGLPSQDLKRSQEKAKQALQGYIEAANHAAKILSLVNQKPQQD